MTEGTPFRRANLIPLFIGVVVFLGVTGGRVLAPSNIAWITDGDARTYYLGWHFYSLGPWQFPIGMSPLYGDELSSSIMFVDNVPLLAMAFKVVRSVLPSPFQYFGLWLLTCCLLQAWFAWLLVGLLTRSNLTRAAGTALFALAPPFLYRFGGHYAMAGQWLLLAALWVSFGPRRLARGPAWPLLALLASLIHSYITAMVLGLWLADLARRLIFEERRRADYVQILAVPAAVWLGFWQAGFFAVGPGVVKSGFGKYRLNLLSLIDSSGWSYFLPDVPEGSGDYEGFNYLGLGGIVLSVAALPALAGAWRSVRTRRHYWPMLALLGGLSLFAVSNRVGIAGAEVVLPLPVELVERCNALRGSGRMFWPVFYVLLWVTMRALLRRYPHRWSAALLVVAALLQAADTSAGWLPIRTAMSPVGSTWPSPLRAPFWEQAAVKYRRIHLVQPKNQKPGWEVFAYFAATHGMVTDAFYAARVDQDKLRSAQRRGARAVSSGRYDPDTLYILDKKLVREARRALDPTRDSMRQVDGYWVVAPGWGCGGDCAPSTGEPTKEP